MKKLNLVISLVVALAIVFLGLRYVNSKKMVEGPQSSPISQVEIESPVLPSQEGLPQAVEAKRHAIFQASFEKNFEKLKAELEIVDGLNPLGSFGPDGTPASRSFLDSEGKQIFTKWGISGFTALAEQENEVSIFDLVPAFLKLPYGIAVAGEDLPYVQNWWATKNLPLGTKLYIWPYLVTKSPKDLTTSDTNNMKTFLSDEQIKTFSGEYHYPNIVITEDGKWVAQFGMKD